MKAIIMAGGHDDNLGPLTLDIPTAALPVAGKPMVARVLDYLEHQGVTEAIVSCYRWPDRVEQAIQQYSGSLQVTTVLESPPFGSANLVRRLAAGFHERFLVTTVDILTDIDLSPAVARHAQSSALATVLVAEVDPPCPYGEVATDHNGSVVMVGSENLVRRRGKRIANTGIYILEPGVLDHVPDDRSFDLVRNLLPALVEKEATVLAARADGFWLSIRSHEHYRVANVAILRDYVRGMRPAGEETSPGIWLAGEVRIDSRAVLNPPVLIGKGSQIERDAVIGPNAILGEGVHVRRGASVWRTVVMPASKVGLATKLQDSLVRGNVVAKAANPELTYVDDTQVLEALEPAGIQLILRSVIDRVVALAAVALLSPLFLLIALLIRLDSRGPVLYSQLRVGQGRRSSGGQYQGAVFELMKFRTMYQDADQRLKDVMNNNEYGSAPFVKIKNDPRITRVGKFLRATSLDELPQLLNVVKGEMGLVGNRPLPLYEAEQLGDDWQRIRFNAPAGITGLWQISGRSDLSAEERIILDNYYALTRSAWSDIKILLLTLPVLLARRGAR